MNIQEWQTQHSDVDLYASSGGGFTFEPGYAYIVKSKEVKVVESKRGDSQLAISLSVLSPNGTTLGAGTHYLDFPCQKSDDTLSKEAVVGLTHRRRDDLMRLLIAAGIIKASTPEKERYKQTIEWSATTREHINGTVDELADVTFYLSVKANPNKPDYPYKNVYNEAPKGLPLYTGEEQHGDA